MAGQYIHLLSLLLHILCYKRRDEELSVYYFDRHFCYSSLKSYYTEYQGLYRLVMLRTLADESLGVSIEDYRGSSNKDDKGEETLIGAILAIRKLLNHLI